MAVTSRSLRTPSGPRLNQYKIGAALAQIGSFLTTYAFFVAVLTDAPWYMVLAISVGTEFLLLLGKSLLLNSDRQDDAIGWGAILFDTLLNAGGLWPYASRIALTPTAIMFAEAFDLNKQISSLAALILALIVGYLLAVMPWRLWKAGSPAEEE